MEEETKVKKAKLGPKMTQEDFERMMKEVELYRAGKMPPEKQKAWDELPEIPKEIRVD